MHPISLAFVCTRAFFDTKSGWYVQAQADDSSAIKANSNPSRYKGGVWGDKPNHAASGGISNGPGDQLLYASYKIDPLYQESIKNNMVLGSLNSQ